MVLVYTTDLRKVENYPLLWHLGLNARKIIYSFYFIFVWGLDAFSWKWFRKHKPVLTIISHHLSGNPSWWPSHAWYTIRWHQPCTRTDARKQVPAMCDSHVTVTAWHGWTTATYLLFSPWSPLWLYYSQHIRAHSFWPFLVVKILVL
jgi:hypothetical protein